MEDDLNSLQIFFYNYGMGVGSYAPIKRFLFGLGLASIPIYILKPRIMFNSDGTFRKWSALSDDKESVLFPWWSPGLILGAVFSLFF